MNTILDFLSENGQMLAMLILMCAICLLVGCNSTDTPNPYKSGKTAYSVLKVSVDEDDIENVDKVIDDVARIVLHLDTNETNGDSLVNVVLSELAKHYDDALIHLITNILDEYWGHIDSAYLKGKLADIDENGKYIKKIDYFIKFVRGLVDQKELQK